MGQKTHTLRVEEESAEWIRPLVLDVFYRTISETPITVAHYTKLKYHIKPVEKDNKGWDLEARHPALKASLKLEVKGLSGGDTCVEVTPNEYARMSASTGQTRLWMIGTGTDYKELYVDIYVENVTQSTFAVPAGAAVRATKNGWTASFEDGRVQFVFCVGSDNGLRAASEFLDEKLLEPLSSDDRDVVHGVEQTYKDGSKVTRYAWSLPGRTRGDREGVMSTTVVRPNGVALTATAIRAKPKTLGTADYSFNLQWARARSASMLVGLLSP